MRWLVSLNSSHTKIKKTKQGLCRGLQGELTTPAFHSRQTERPPGLLCWAVTLADAGTPPKDFEWPDPEQEHREGTVKGHDLSVDQKQEGEGFLSSSTSLPQDCFNWVYYMNYYTVLLTTLISERTEAWTVSKNSLFKGKLAHVKCELTRKGTAIFGFAAFNSEM